MLTLDVWMDGRGRGYIDGQSNEHSHGHIHPTLQLHAELILSGFQPLDSKCVFNRKLDIRVIHLQVSGSDVEKYHI